MDRRDDALGDVGEGDPGLLRGHCSGQDARADQEQALLPEQPQAIEELLVGIRVRKRGLQPLRDFLAARHRAEEPRIDQSVHQPRLLRQHVAEARRGADDRGDQRDQVGILLQQREQRRTALHGLQEAVELGQRAIRVLRPRKVAEQLRQQALQRVARRLRTQGAIVVAGKPALQRFGNRRRLLEAQRGDMLQQPGIVGATAEIELRQGRRRGSLVLEQLAVVPLDATQVPEQHVGERVPTGKAEEPGEPLDGLGLFGKRVGLLIGDHLQPMLDAAQELVGACQLIARLLRDPVALPPTAPASRASAASAARDAARRQSAAASARRTRSRECRHGPA